MSYGQYMGKQFAVPGKRAFLGKYSSFIRTDWLEKLGMDVPQTTDELYEVLKAFKEQDPGQTGGKVIPFGMTIEPAQYDPLIWSFIQPTTEEQKYTRSKSSEPMTTRPCFRASRMRFNSSTSCTMRG